MRIAKAAATFATKHKIRLHRGADGYYFLLRSDGSVGNYSMRTTGPSAIIMMRKHLTHGFNRKLAEIA